MARFVASAPLARCEQLSQASQSKCGRSPALRGGAARYYAWAALAALLGVACAGSRASRLGPDVGFSHADARPVPVEVRGKPASRAPEPSARTAVAAPPAVQVVDPCARGPQSLADAHCSRPAEWPESTRSLEVRELVHVRAEPDRQAFYVGKVTRGTRVGWTRVTRASDPPPGASNKAKKRALCPYWVNIEPFGFLCSDVLKPSSEEPAGRRQPVLAAGTLLPGAYYAILNAPTPAYRNPDDVRAASAAEQLSKRFMLVGYGAVSVDGVAYLKTDHGLVEQAALGRFSPSSFAGVDLRAAPPTSWPFAWLTAARGVKVTIYSEPSKTGTVARKAGRREIVPVLEQRADFVRISDSEWVSRDHVHVANLTAPPSDVLANEQWIDVDLDEQVLVAYEGALPVFATLVSTGRERHGTPPAMYRVRAKAATTPMLGGDKNAPNRYEVSEVPWAIRFRHGLFIHAAYWHDAFGSMVSHGCVNVSPKDALLLFDWLSPAMPDGWSELEVPAGAGAVVRVRDRTSPAPPAFDYENDEPEPKRHL